MFWTLISALLPPLFKAAATAFGDQIIAKWASELRLWWRKTVEPGIQQEADRRYDLLEQQWDDLKWDRQGRPPAPPKL